MPVRPIAPDLRSIALQFALAGAGYLVLTVLLFHGLIGRFSTAVPHDLGDPLLSSWILWWNAHRLPFVGSWWDGLGFFPVHGSLAFSDHRVGLTSIAGPVQWLGGSPILAYNVTLLSTFVLSALAAHGLTWLLTKSHSAGAVAGLVFGFNPFRISHVAHLELLAAFWLPLALAALHLYVRRFDVRWLAVFAACWLLQGLSSGYYLFYSAPVIALWAFWFARDKPARGVFAIGIACLAVAAALVPVLLHYRNVQDRLLLTRSFAEIESFSADLTGIVSATPKMALWRVPSLASNGEAEIYLGIVAPLLMVIGLAIARRPTSNDARRWPATRKVVAAIGALYALIAAGTFVGPWTLNLGPITLSARQTVQPLSIAVLCAIVLVATSRPVAGAFRRHSTFGFYVASAVMTWSLTLGPRPAFLGRQLLYRGPYELLMLLPGFADRLRVPARFVMMTALMVAVASGIALLRLTASQPRSRRVAITVVALVALALDSWTFALPMPAVPPFLRLPDSVPPTAAVVELPLGGVGPDIAAVYRSIRHGRHVVNGYSGYEPPHYRVLRTALRERDDSALTTLTRFAPIVVAVDEQSDPGGAFKAFAARHGGALELEQSGDYSLYLLPQDPTSAADDRSSERATHEAALTVRSATSSVGPFDLTAVTDDNRETAWASPPQRGGEEVVLDLGGPSTVIGLSLSSGPALEGYPRLLSVAVSIDGSTWDETWSGSMAGPTIEGVLEDAARAAGRISFPARRARFVRLRQLGSQPDFGWFIAELKVYGLLPS